MSSSSLSSSSLLWGRDHEPHARDQYTKSLPEGWSVQECGVFISAVDGFLGSSPDGLVFNGDKLLSCIEIKCPFSARDKSLFDACLQPQFFCKRDENGEVHLKCNHNHYFQVQGQMAILNLPWCDFIVWTTIDFHIERITKDPDFWDRCLSKLKLFYSKIMLPEIVYPRHPLNITL